MAGVRVSTRRQLCWAGGSRLPHGVLFRCVLVGTVEGPRTGTGGPPVGVREREHRDRERRERRQARPGGCGTGRHGVDRRESEQRERQVVRAAPPGTTDPLFEQRCHLNGDQHVNATIPHATAAEYQVVTNGTSTAAGLEHVSACRSAAPTCTTVKTTASTPRNRCMSGAGGQGRHFEATSSPRPHTTRRSRDPTRRGRLLSRCPASGSRGRFRLRQVVAAGPAFAAVIQHEHAVDLSGLERVDLVRTGRNDAFASASAIHLVRRCAVLANPPAAGARSRDRSDGRHRRGGPAECESWSPLHRRRARRRRANPRRRGSRCRCPTPYRSGDSPWTRRSPPMFTQMPATRSASS